MDTIPGQVVRSKAGRDQGKYFVVIRISEDKNFLFLADGRLRKVDNPKKKKIKHIEILKIHSEKIAQKLAEEKNVQNSEIVKELRQLTENR